MRRRSKASSKLAKARSRKAKTLKAVRHSSSSASGQETEVARLTRELHEAQEQQRATSEILGVVARSRTDVQSVLDTVCQSAAQLCEAYDATIWRPDGDRLLPAAHHGPITQIESVPLVRGTVLGRSILDKRTFHIADFQTQAAEFPITSEYARRLGFRTGLYVPLMREGVAIGVIALRRSEAQLFTERQVALLRTFADQAVIAIENARLLNELRQRTADLSESLEQQTATSEVLKVISASPGDLKPVFESLLANAKRLCGAKFGTLLLREGSAVRCVAIHGATAEYTEARQRAPVIEPAPDTALGRVLKTKQVIQIADIQKVPGYVANPVQAPLVQLAGARSILSVPMLKEKELVGIVEIYRQEVQPFTEKQVALLENFAAQAVIAIENARLLNEFRDSLGRQTATSEVLSVISSSRGNLAPVFHAILENATRICEATFGSMLLRESEGFRRAALHNAPQQFEEFNKNVPIFRRGMASSFDHAIRYGTGEPHFGRGGGRTQRTDCQVRRSENSFRCTNA
jgi:GAF domain-containing protein